MESYVPLMMALTAGAMLSILISFVNKALPFVNLIATLFTFTVIQRRELHSSIAFTSITLFQSLSSQFIYVGMIARSTVNVRPRDIPLIIDVGQSQAYR
jgi:hypothetical protein